MSGSYAMEHMNISLESQYSPSRFVSRVDLLKAREHAYQERVASTFSRATSSAAIAAHLVIQEAYAGGGNISSDEVKRLKVAIDTAAVTALSEQLHAQPHFHIHSVGSEGAKEVLHDGEEAPSLQGKFGHHLNEHWVDKVSDAIEGTTAAAHNAPGAVSIMAISAKGALRASVDHVFYMDKLMGPPQVAGVISLDLPVHVNLERTCLALGICPRELNVVILNRPRNHQYIKEVTLFGATPILIEAGDLMPALLAVQDVESHKKGAHLLMGIGGLEEGVIAAAGARATGGSAEARLWSNETGTHLGETLTLDDLVGADAAVTSVIATAVTSDPWFDLEPVRSTGNGKSLTSQTLVISQSGRQVIAHEYALH